MFLILFGLFYFFSLLVDYYAQGNIIILKSPASTSPLSLIIFLSFPASSLFFLSPSLALLIESLFSPKSPSLSLQIWSLLYFLVVA